MALVSVTSTIQSRRVQAFPTLQRSTLAGVCHCDIQEYFIQMPEAVLQKSHKLHGRHAKQYLHDGVGMRKSFD